tara:strand:+ start:638 stop:997 length:360 start_codon:yes stop_codon:yes gene_type:complete
MNKKTTGAPRQSPLETGLSESATNKETIMSTVKKDTRVAITLEQANVLRPTMSSEDFTKNFRLKGINALTVFTAKNPEHPIVKAISECGKSQFNFKIGDENWVLRVNGARVKPDESTTK